MGKLAGSGALHQRNVDRPGQTAAPPTASSYNCSEREAAPPGGQTGRANKTNTKCIRVLDNIYEPSPPSVSLLFRWPPPGSDCGGDVCTNIQSAFLWPQLGAGQCLTVF